jgi:hypothetical protein
MVSPAQPIQPTCSALQQKPARAWALGRRPAALLPRCLYGCVAAAGVMISRAPRVCLAGLMASFPTKTGWLESSTSPAVTEERRCAHDAPGILIEAATSPATAAERRCVPCAAARLIYGHVCLPAPQIVWAVEQQRSGIFRWLGGAFLSVERGDRLARLALSAWLARLLPLQGTVLTRPERGRGGKRRIREKLVAFLAVQ